MKTIFQILPASLLLLTSAPSQAAYDWCHFKDEESKETFEHFLDDYKVTITTASIVMATYYTQNKESISEKYILALYRKHYLDTAETDTDEEILIKFEYLVNSALSIYEEASGTGFSLNLEAPITQKEFEETYSVLSQTFDITYEYCNPYNSAK